MATMAGERVALSRQPIWVLKLILDGCAEDNGQAPCTAASGCNYTYSTCKDKPNYNKSTRTYQFTNRGAPYIAGALPLLKPIRKLIPTKIRQDKFKPERGKMQFELQEDDALPLANPSKMANSQADTGRFLRNMLARNPNYKGRICELYRGYTGVDPANFDLYWRGYIVDMDFTKDGIEVIAVDLLWKCIDKKLPNKISDDNVVTDNPLTAGAGTVNVTDGTEFESASANEPRVIKIEDEYIIYTAKAGNALTGCTRGAYNTTGVAHAQDTEIVQAYVMGASDYSEGEYGDHLLLDLICNRAEIDAGYINVVDTSVTLNGAIIAGDTTITVAGVVGLPGHGVIKIEDEFIYYASISGDNLLTCKRGMYGTTAAGHADTTPVYPTCFTNELGNWHQSGRYKGKFLNSKKASYFIELIQQASILDMWMNEAGEIECKIQSQHNDETATALTEADMIPGSRKVRRNEKNRITRVSVYHLPSEEDPGSSPDDYTRRKLYIDAIAEGVNKFDDITEKVIYSPVCENATEALWMGAHIFQRNREVCPSVEFETELYYDNIKVGDVITISIPEIVDKDAARNIRRYRIIEKQQMGLNRLRFMAEDTGFGDKRYPVISPSAVNMDYDAATAAQQAIYGWIADLSDELGAANDPAYLNW